jgi:hypothetical protein
MSRVVAAVAAVAMFAACGTSSSDKSCPADEPETCPASGAPSYATDVAPIFAQYCSSSCHGPGGSASDRPLSSYADVEKIIDDVNSQVYDCLMPMRPAPDPTLAQRVALLTWIVCGSPDN